MVVLRLVDLTRIVCGVCKVELTPGESAVESALAPNERGWYTEKAADRLRNNIQVAIPTFPAIPGSHSRLAGSPGSVSLPVSRTWLSQGHFPQKNDCTPYARAGVS